MAESPAVSKDDWETWIKNAANRAESRCKNCTNVVWSVRIHFKSDKSKTDYEILHSKSQVISWAMDKYNGDVCSATIITKERNTTDPNKIGYGITQSCE